MRPSFLPKLTQLSDLRGPGWINENQHPVADLGKGPKDPHHPFLEALIFFNPFQQNDTVAKACSHTISFWFSVGRHDGILIPKCGLQFL